MMSILFSCLAGCVVASILVILRRQGKTYEQIAERIGVSGALIWKVMKGLCTSRKARAYFGLPPKTVEVEPCRCGEVHMFSHPNPRDKGRHRRAGEFTGERVKLYDSELKKRGLTTTFILNHVLDEFLHNSLPEVIISVETDSQP